MTGDDATVGIPGGGARSDADLEAIQRELETALTPGIHVLRLLGRGGMGAVFVGRDPVLKRQVVIKVLAPELAHDATARARFAREAESAAAVSHPNVVSVFLVGELPRSGTSYFVMQFIAGPTLADACPLGTKVPQARCRRIVGEIASALAAAHARDLIHRDIKPTNVMLEGETERAMVLDFGISAAMTPRGAPGGTRLTVEGVSLGTPEYMSPEQGIGDAVTDRSDVYSLGVLAFELLTGRAPFAASTAFALIAAHIKDTPANVALERPDIDTDFAELVNRMLAKDPTARPSAAEVARACAQSVQLIEWPPPGLERVRGTGVLGLRLWGAYGVGLAAFFITLAAQGGAPGGVGVLVLALLGFAHMILIVGASISAGQVVGLARWARRSGYPFRISIDVALDRHPDTAALLNGTGRFSTIPAATSRRWLARRRTAAIAVLTGVGATSVLAVLWSMGILHFDPPDPARIVRLSEFAVIFAPILAGWLTSVALRLPERAARGVRTVAGGTSLRAPAAAIPAELVEGWLKGMTLPVPPPFRGGRIVASHVAESLATVIILCGIAGGLVAFLFVAILNFSGVPQVNADAWQRAVNRALSVTGGRAVWDSVMSRSALAAVAIAGPSSVRALIDANESAGFDAELPWRALHAMPGRLPDSVRSALALIATDPALTGFRQVASAPPLPAGWYAPAGAITTENLERLGRRLHVVGRVASRNVAAAALALDRGETREATLRAREIISVGRLLANDPLPAAHRIGIGLVRMGARVLEEIGIVTGNAALVRESGGLRATVEGRESVNKLFEAFTVAAAAASPMDSSFALLAGDARLLPVDRWAVAAATATGSCMNISELRSGVSQRRYEMLALAETQLSDIARSDEWVRRWRTGLEAVGRGQATRVGEHPAASLRWLAGSLSRAVTCGAAF